MKVINKVATSRAELFTFEEYEKKINNIASEFTGSVCDNTSISRLSLELDVIRYSAKQNHIDISSLFPIIIDCGAFELRYNFLGQITKIMKAPMEHIEIEVVLS